MSLREQIAAESRIAVERRTHAMMLSTNSFIDWETAQEARPTEPYVVSRDPCPWCATRGDLDCAHRKASRREEAPDRPQRLCRPDQFRPKAATWSCGHPRTPANTHDDGRCLHCRRKLERDASRRYRQRRAG